MTTVNIEKPSADDFQRGMLLRHLSALKALDGMRDWVSKKMLPPDEMNAILDAINDESVYGWESMRSQLRQMKK